MHPLFDILLVLHASAGCLALLAGPIPMLARKGGSLHRKAGRIYAAAMVATAFSALVLSLWIGSILLLVISVFVFFLIFTGVRALGRRRGRPLRKLDWVVPWATLAFCTGLIVRGVVVRDVTSLVFGLGGGFLAIRELQALRNPNTAWLLQHIAGMLGAYIATVSAFLAVNLTFLPKPIPFIGPALIGTPLIIWMVRRYRRPSGLATLPA